ncbi:MAG: RNA methyltransferase [Pseudomonadales bacterium]|nr:RNA methyltransferase [Pseudomonadales bacterium]
MFENIRVVMIHTSHPGNIGAAARAIKTMGFSRLVLVSPQDYPNAKATWRAAGATDVLDQTQVVETLADAVAGCSLVVGASARQRRIPWPVLDSRQGGEAIAKQARTDEVAVIFGREDRGLTNEELQQCHYHIEIPANDSYGVLNVASAIQIICYDIRMALTLIGKETLTEDNEAEEGNTKPDFSMPIEPVRWDERLATSGEMEHFFKHMETTLTQLDFHEPANPRQLITRLRRLFMRSRLDRLEINILRGAMTAVQKKMGLKG